MGLRGCSEAIPMELHCSVVNGYGSDGSGDGFVRV
jgi:hypothetical protein